MAVGKGGNEAANIHARSSQTNKVIEFPSESATDFWAADLHRFILKLRERQANVLERGVSKPLAAHEISIILSELVFRQTGQVVVEDGQELFFDSLCEYGPIKDLFSDLSSRVELFKLNEGTQLTEALSDLDQIVTWYARRALSLHFLEEKGKFRSIDGTVGFLNPRLIYDCKIYDLPGFELQTGIYLKGLAGQTVWVLLRVLSSGRHLQVSPGYEHWACSYASYNLPELSTNRTWACSM